MIDTVAGIAFGIILAAFFLGALGALVIGAYLTIKPKPLEGLTVEQTVINGDDCLRFSFLSGQHFLLPLESLAYILGPTSPPRIDTDAVSHKSMGFVDFDSDDDPDMKGLP